MIETLNARLSEIKEVTLDSKVEAFNGEIVELASSLNGLHVRFEIAVPDRLIYNFDALHHGAEVKVRIAP